MSNATEFIMFESRTEIRNWVGIVQDSKCNIKVHSGSLILDGTTINELMVTPMYEVLKVDIRGAKNDINNLLVKISDFIV